VTPVFEASAPARIDLAGGTLDLWPLHALHPGSVTVNVAIVTFLLVSLAREKRRAQPARVAVAPTPTVTTTSRRLRRALCAADTRLPPRTPSLRHPTRDPA